MAEKMHGWAVQSKDKSRTTKKRRCIYLDEANDLLAALGRVDGRQRYYFDRTKSTTEKADS